MVHPSHYFIKYLLVAQEDISQACIDGTLEMYGMAHVDVKYLESIKAELGPIPSTLKAWDTKDQATNRWLKNQRIFSIVHPDHATKEMRDVILMNPHLRRNVENLLLGRVSEREIAFRVSKMGFKIGDLAVSEYRHYFWNTTLMGVSDWAEYFETDSKSSGTKRTLAEQHIYLAALHGGADVALYKSGIRKELDGKKILVEVQQELYNTFLEVRSLPLSESKVEMLSTITRGLARIDERIQAGDTALQDVLKKFEKFKVLTDSSTPPSLMDLAPTGTISKKSRADILNTRDN